MNDDTRKDLIFGHYGLREEYIQYCREQYCDTPLYKFIDFFGKSFLFKIPTFDIYINIIDRKDISDYEKEDLIFKECLLFPMDYNMEYSPCGSVTAIVRLLIKIAGFTYTQEEYTSVVEAHKNRWKNNYVLQMRTVLMQYYSISYKEIKELSIDEMMELYAGIACMNEIKEDEYNKQQNGFSTQTIDVDKNRQLEVQTMTYKRPNKKDMSQAVNNDILNKYKYGV